MAYRNAVAKPTRRHTSFYRLSDAWWEGKVKIKDDSHDRLCVESERRNASKGESGLQYKKIANVVVSNKCG